MENSLAELERVKAVAPECFSLPKKSDCAVLMRALPDFNPSLEHERIDPVLLGWARAHGVQFMRSQVDLGFLLTVCGAKQDNARLLALSLQSSLHEVFGVDYFISYYAAPAPSSHALVDLEQTAKAAQMLRSTQPVEAGIWSRSNAVQTFRDAIWAGSFKTHAQPIVCMETMEIVGHELLARLFCPLSGELIPCREWVVAVTQGHDSLRLALQMLKSAAGFMQEHDKGFVTINLTGSDLSSPQFRSALEQMPKAQRDRLVLEMVESDDLLSISNIRDHLAFVQGLGCRIALDDFGAAHATFAVLRALKFDIIKLDISLVHSRSQLDRALVGVLLDHVEGTGIKLIAEGIESRELMEEMKTRGLKLGQGFYLDAAKR